MICRRWAEARWKEVNCHIRGFDSLNCLKPYWLRIMIISVLFWLRVVYQGIFLWGIDRVSDCVSSWGCPFHYRQFFGRLTLYYTTEKYFLSTFFQIFLISSIHGGTEAISYIRMCVCVAMHGIPLYSRNTARRHVYVHVCVYTKAFKSGRFHLGLYSSAARFWLLYIYFTK